MNKLFNHPDNVREKNSKASFTLAELLTVIAIIAALMAMIFPAYNYVKTTAKKAKASQDIYNLKIALLACRQEYGYWPDATIADWTDFSAMLNANRNFTNGVINNLAAAYNIKNIRFMDFKAEQLDSTMAFIDPWQTPYAVLMDNGDQAIGKNGWNDVTAEDGQVTKPGGGNPIQSPVAIYSFGADKNDNNGGGDDITSWGN